jgi:hypothetical protein
LVPRGMGVAQGKELWTAPFQQGARGAAVRCQPKPLTRPWVSAVLAIARKDVWQGSVGAFNVWLAHPLAELNNEIAGWSCDILPTGQGMEMPVAPDSVVAGDKSTGTDRRKAATHSVSVASRPAPIRPPIRARRLKSTSSGQVRSQSQPKNDQALKLRPVLPDGALWSAGCRQERAAHCRPSPVHAARRCSSISSSASALSISPPSTSSAADAAAGAGSSGASGSASHAARLAAATVATPPRWV